MADFQSVIAPLKTHALLENQPVHTYVVTNA